MPGEAELALIRQKVMHELGGTVPSPPLPPASGPAGISPPPLSASASMPPPPQPPPPLSATASAASMPPETISDESSDENTEEEEEELEGVVAEVTSGVAELDAAGSGGVAAEDPDKMELFRWSELALRHQIESMGLAPLAPDAGKPALVDAYWAALGREGKQRDESVRRFLILRPDSVRSVRSSDAMQPEVAVGSIEELVRTWVSCVTGTPLSEGPLQPSLRSGEVLCNLVNALQPGIVPKVAREADTAVMPDSKRNAKMRENVGQCVPSTCAPSEILTAPSAARNRLADWHLLLLDTIALLQVH